MQSRMRTKRKPVDLAIRKSKETSTFEQQNKHYDTLPKIMNWEESMELAEANNKMKASVLEGKQASKVVLTWGYWQHLLTLIFHFISCEERRSQNKKHKGTTKV